EQESISRVVVIKELQELSQLVSPFRKAQSEVRDKNARGAPSVDVDLSIDRGARLMPGVTLVVVGNSEYPPFSKESIDVAVVGSPHRGSCHSVKAGGFR